MGNENTTPKKQDNNEPEQESKRRKLALNLQEAKPIENADEVIDQLTREFSKLWKNDPEFKKSLDKSISALVEAATYIKETTVKIRKLYPELEESTIRRLTIPQIKKLLEQKETDQAGQAEKLLEITGIYTNKVPYPVDKPNNNIWNALKDANPNGQLHLNINTAPKGTKDKNGEEKKALIYYGIDFKELDPSLKVSKKLTQFDKRVYIATNSLFQAGNLIVTITQIHRQMGNTTSPSPRQTDKILKSLNKMRTAFIVLDTNHPAAGEKSETKVFKGNYPNFKYESYLLPIEIITAKKNGQITENAIHILREPPLITFAREREQITTIPLEVLDSPLNKSDANLRIDDYLIEEISQMKNAKNKSKTDYYNGKRLYETIFKNCEINTPKQKQRAKGKIRDYLTHYKKCGFIKGYQESARGVTIIL